MKKLIAFVLVAMLALALVACGGDETTTTKPATSTTPTVTTTTPAVTTTPTPVVTTTPTPVVTTTPQTTVITTPVVTEPLSAPEQYIADWDAAEDKKEEEDDTYFAQYASWIQTHESLTINHDATGADGVVYPYMFHFSFKTDSNPFPTDPVTATPGIQYTTGDSIFIAECDEFGDPIGEYKKYEISYWKPDQWYLIDCVASGFVPEDGKYYDVFLFFMTDDDPNHSQYPSCLHYMWDFGNPFLYEEPEPVETVKKPIEEMLPDYQQRTQLFYHDAFTISPEGAFHYTFKSDNQPFAQPTDPETGAQVQGLSYTALGEVYVDGERVSVSNYTTTDWYIIDFVFDDFEFESGQTYEILIAIEALDDSGTYCNDPDGYFILMKEYVHP